MSTASSDARRRLRPRRPGPTDRPLDPRAFGPTPARRAQRIAPATRAPAPTWAPRSITLLSTLAAGGDLGERRDGAGAHRFEVAPRIAEVVPGPARSPRWRSGRRAGAPAGRGLRGCRRGLRAPRAAAGWRSRGSRRSRAGSLPLPAAGSCRSCTTRPSSARPSPPPSLASAGALRVSRVASAPLSGASPAALRAASRRGCRR